MGFPADRDALIQSGYKFENHGVCRGCKAELEWWTTSTGKRMPFNLMQSGNSIAQAHFVTCPNAEEFRRG